MSTGSKIVAGMRDAVAMAKAEALLALAERVEAGESGGLIERAIAFAIGAVADPWGDVYHWILSPSNTVQSTVVCQCGSLLTSLDAVEALRVALLPKRRWSHIFERNDGWWTAKLADEMFGSNAPTECQARLAALLRAKAAEIEAKEVEHAG